MKRGSAVGLLMIAAIVVSVVAATLTSGSGSETTQQQLNAGAVAVGQQLGSPGNTLTLKDHKIVAHIAPVSMETNADGSFVQDLGVLVDSAISTVWKTVPGNYESVCVEADNMKSTCMTATTMSGKYGPRGSGGSSTEAATPVTTPHGICALQVYAIAAHLYDQGGTAMSAEVELNGFRDTFFVAAEDVWRGMLTDEPRVGMASAKENASAMSNRLCTTTLNDQVRANYPTDGTYPDTGSSGDSGGGGGSSVPSCPNGGTAVGTDAQGNTICNMVPQGNSG